MSTKTTFKRIALVAVAALGFGVLASVAPASAADTDTATSSFALNASSFTVVGGGSGDYAVIEVTAKGNSTGLDHSLASTESIALTTTAWPTTIDSATAASDLVFTVVQSANVATGAKGSNATSAVNGWTATGGVIAADNQNVDNTVRNGGTAVAATTTYAGSAAAKGTYFVAVSRASGKALDKGSYTVRMDLLSSGNVIQRSTVKVTFVTSKVDAAAVLTATATGPQKTGAALYNTLTQNISATLKDANGGLVREGNNAAPALTANLKDADTTIHTDTVVMTDDGTTDAVDAVGNNGVYEGSTSGNLTNVAGTSTFTVRYGTAVATASVTVMGAASQYAKTSVTATGKVASGTDYIVPLTTKSVSVSVAALTTNDATTAVAATGKTLYYTLSYSGCVTADVTTKVSAPTKVITDANGVATVTIAHANPANNCAATVTFTGATAFSNSDVLVRTITWKAPVATTVVSDPSTGYKALVGSANKVTWTVLDQFNNPVVGKTATFTISGANKPTAGLPSQVTDAKGQLSFSWTDAAAVVADATLGATTVAVATVGADTPTTLGSVTVTYVAALPVTASINAYYGTITSAAASIVAPSTNIGGSAGLAIGANDQKDQADIITASDPGSVLVKFSPLTSAAAAVSGVPMVVTVTGGAKLLDSVGYLATTRTVYGSTTFTVVGLKTGVSTVTAVQGAVTKSVTINFVNADTDARVIKVAESAGTVTATVTDGLGNAVAGVTVGASLSGAGRLGNGATSGTFVTAADGTVSFDVNGAATATVSLSSTYTKASFLAGYGDATGTVVTTGAPAGVRTASVATAGNTVVADNAQSAVDAAAEATDAANAATDAANAAAEAADAATAAAQDAADAVAALSTQVTEMVSALKKQITALTNLVIKIQKKVKA
jgi:hypothetical protein